MSEIPFSAHWIASQPPEARQAAVRAMNPDQLLTFRHKWSLWARDEQKPPPVDWRVWLYLAGRGAGKTRSGAEWVRAQVEAGRRRVALVAPTAADARGARLQLVTIEAGGMSKLTPKQARFVQEYLTNLNATQAAIRAGYSPKAARFVGCKNITKANIAAAIEKAQTRRAERVELTADWVVDELRKIAGVNMADYLKSTTHGDPYRDFFGIDA